MAALAAKDRAQVDRIYKLAVEMGGKTKVLRAHVATVISMPPIFATSTATSLTPL
jgi:hypothetical protein